MLKDSHRALLQNYGTLLARVVIGVFFIMAGISKLGAGFAGTVAYIQMVGLPMPEVLTVAAIILELCGGIGILLGWYTSYAALALIFVCLFTAAFFHNNFANQIQMTMFMKNLAIAAGLTFIAAYGPGTGMSMDKK